VLQPLHQLRQADAECSSDGFDVPQGQIPFASLNPADIGAIQDAGRGKRLLRIALRLPQFADPLSESFQNVRCAFSHADYWNVDNEYRSGRIVWFQLREAG
jgi:hypothetical protein